VRVERVLSWSDPSCSGQPRVSSAQPAAGDRDPVELGRQAPPRNGIGPRVDAARAAERLRGLPHVLAGYLGADGFPTVAPVDVGEAAASGIALSGPLPPGGRRAGVLGHRYEAQLIGLETRQYTGWLEDGVYAPHTENGFRAPANKTLLLLANGLMARRGLRQARAAGRA
jgi:hypothetical protein